MSIEIFFLRNSLSLKSSQHQQFNTNFHSYRRELNTKEIQLFQRSLIEHLDHSFHRKLSYTDDVKPRTNYSRLEDESLNKLNMLEHIIHYVAPTINLKQIKYTIHSNCEGIQIRKSYKLWQVFLLNS